MDKQKEKKINLKDRIPFERLIRFGSFRFPLIFVTLCLCVFVTCLAYAQDISFEADVNTTSVALGSYIRLTLTATGTQQVDSAQLPDIDGFESEFIGPSSRVSIVNGKQSSSYSLLYNLYPKKTGQLVIPPINVSVEGKNYTTQQIVITVVDSAEDSSGAGVAGSVTALKDRLFFVISTSKQESYLNEKIPIVIRLYVGGVSVRDIEMPRFDQVGFLIDEFQQPKQYQQIVNGLKYNIVEFETNIYPTRTGVFEFGPLKQRCNVIFKDANSSSRSRGFFDDDFFGDFFSVNTSRPVELTSNAVSFSVNPLPQEGQPKDFSGAVGNYSFNMDASPKHLKVGDPVTLRMKVAGSGNLKTVELKGFESSQDFKAYEAQIKQEGDVKILEQVLIPQHEKATQIPQVNFSFFDTQQKQYRVISWGPVELEVDPIAAGEEFSVVGLPDQAQRMFVRKDNLGKDISFIKDRLGKMYPRGYRVYRSVLFICVVLGIVIFWVGGFLLYQFTRRLKTDEHFARRLQAPRYARLGLKSAKVYLDKNDAALFYDQLFVTLQKYFSHKLHMSPGAVLLTAIEKKINERKKETVVLTKVQQVIEQCEAVRYASANFSHDEMSLSFQKACEIIDWFERKF